MPDSPRARRWRHALRWALAGYTVVLVLVLGWPTPTTPVIDTLDVVSSGIRDAGGSLWTGYLNLEFGANIALFVPFGLLLALVLRPGRWWAAVLGGFGFSLVAEITQGVFLPGRSATLSDVVANTAGTLVGACLAVLLSRRWVDLHPSRLPRPPSAASPRRATAPPSRSAYAHAMPDWTLTHRHRLRWALAGYSAVLAYVLGWPTPTAPVVGTLGWVNDLVRLIGASDWADPPAIEFTANIALFVPFGLLLALVLRHGQWWVAVLGGFGVSLFAEVMQGLFLAGRSGTVSDVVANTAGTIIGAGIAVLLARRPPRP
jgi:glycopeptide antibiotics resistance protein